MKKILTSGIIAGIILLLISQVALHLTLIIFPGIAVQYFDPAFDTGSDKIIFFYLHPFVISLALAWFWSRFKGVLSGSFITRGIEFGLIYVVIATIPMMWMIYAAMNVSLAIVGTWSFLSLIQGIVAGLVFEKMNP